MTFIALDVGNTRLKWAMYDSPRTDAALLSQGAVFLENIDKLADEDWKALPPATRMLGCIVAGDALRRRVDEQLELWDLTPSWVVPSASEAGLHNGYDHPTRLGADRWVAMIGALARMRSQTTLQAPRPMASTAAMPSAITPQGSCLNSSKISPSPRSRS